MQTHGGTAAEDAILSKERSFRIAVYVDWDGTGDPLQPLGELSDYIDTIEVERSLKGSAPDELLLVEGNSAAELSMTIGGEIDGMSLSNVFSRYNTLSPMYGKRTVGAKITYQIIVDTPVGNFLYQQFVGSIRTINPNRGDATVDITALDYVEQLRQPVQIPMWAMSEAAVQFGEMDSQVCWSHSLMDTALRLCDVGVGPKRPTFRSEMAVNDLNKTDKVQFFLPGNGSIIPTIGWLDNPNADAFPNRGKAMYTEDRGRPHPDAPADSPAPQTFAGVGTANPPANVSPAKAEWEGVIRYWAADRAAVSAYGYYYQGMTLNNPAQAAAITGERYLMEYKAPWGRVYNVMIGGGYIWARKLVANPTTYVDSNKVAIPTNAPYADVHVQWDNSQSTGSRVQVRCGPNSTGWHARGSVNTYQLYLPEFNILGRISIANIVDMSDVYLSTRVTNNRPVDDVDQCYRTPSYVAVLDRGQNRMSHIPDGKPVEAWQLLTDLAAAEYGSVFWDEYGVFRFWNRKHLDDLQRTPVRSVTLDDLSTLNWTDNLDSVRNIYTVTAKRKRAVFENSVYSSSDPNDFVTPAQQSKVHSVWVGDVMSPLPWRMGRYSGGGSGIPKFENDPHGYVVQFLHPPGWTSNGTPTGEGWYEENLQPDPLVIVGFDGNGYMQVRVDNFSVLPIRFASGMWDADRNNDAGAFNVRGTNIVDSGEQTFIARNDVSIAQYGPKNLDINGEWIQDTYTGSNMVSLLMQRTTEPIPTTDDITIPADPRLQLGDTLTLDDAQGYGANIPVQIIGIKRSGGASEPFTDVLTVEVCRRPSQEPPPPDTGAPPMPIRTNLSPNPRLQNDATGWYGGSRTTNNAFPQSATGYFVNTGRCITPQCQVPEPGQNYSGSLYMMPLTSGAATVSVDWYEDGQYFASGGSRRIAFFANELIRLSMVSIPPQRATHGLLVVDFTGQATFSQFLFEKALIVDPGQPKASDPLLYFDGGTNPPHTSWDGAPGNSTSTYIP